MVQHGSEPHDLSAIGLMSGTSMDGVDAAVLWTDGCGRVRPGPALTLDYDPAFRADLRALIDAWPVPADRAGAAARALTERHVEAVAALRARLGPEPIDVVGFHGHTVLHAPERNETVQIGDGALLARETGLAVVADFRSADVAAGGQGAPLVPVFHGALAARQERPLAVLNLGGVANVTWVGPDPSELLAFDTGPGNALLDDWVRARTGAAMDENGALAAGGRADEALVARLAAGAYFDRPPPKSLDRNAFAGVLEALDGLSAADGAATLTRLTATCVARGATWFPAPPARWAVGGGGRRNACLMAALGAVLPEPVVACEALGWNGDALEAQAFAYLAVRRLRDLPITFPGTTGVGAPLTGGVIHRP